ncbi:hypothetical protein [Heyndrickxia acidiproducens]|uniref:hypothetical protein n=1 Tax=Heyndrickxia acidiproducens TaxID=1121084 RepID=UPI000380F61B|nr:hypothetical protein [Heyndrickxia acidiproducens]
MRGNDELLEWLDTFESELEKVECSLEGAIQKERKNRCIRLWHRFKKAERRVENLEKRAAAFKNLTACRKDVHDFIEQSKKTS